MSAKRKADIDSIQTALTSGTDVPENTNPGTLLPSGPGADVVPDEPASLTPEQKEANKLAEKYKAEQLKLAKEQESLVKAQTQQTIQATKQAIGSLKNGIGSVAIPGGLGLPLAVLLILFMLLVKINGNTRIGWLWLVVTGNAEVQGDVTGSGGSGGETPEQEAGVENGVLYRAPVYEPLPPVELGESWL